MKETKIRVRAMIIVGVAFIWAISILFTGSFQASAVRHDVDMHNAGQNHPDPSPPYCRLMFLHGHQQKDCDIDNGTDDIKIIASLWVQVGVITMPPYIPGGSTTLDYTVYFYPVNVNGSNPVSTQSGSISVIGIGSNNVDCTWTYRSLNEGDTIYVTYDLDLTARDSSSALIDTISIIAYNTVSTY